MKVPKILILDTAPMLWDGITMVIYNYLSNMDKKDLMIDVASINDVDNNLQEKFKDLGCKFHKLTSRNTSQIKYIRDLARLVKKEGYDIVHVHCNSCTAAIDLLGARLGGCRVVIPHSHNTKTAHSRAHKLLRPLFNILYTDRFACGYEAGQWLFPGKDVKIWKNAIDTQRFAFCIKGRERLRDKYNLKGKIAVGHVAHFTPHKNHEFLIDVWAEVIKNKKNYVLFLIGDGRLREDIENKVKSLDLTENVVFTGIQQDIPDYLSAMDLMVLPSLYEGLPLVAIEWQISGVQSIIADTVTEECKLTDSVKFVNLDKNAWAKAILSEKILDENERTKISSENIDKIKIAGFDIKSAANDLKEYYLSCKNR